jgi:hypothetical protein
MTLSRLSRSGLRVLHSGPTPDHGSDKLLSRQAKSKKTKKEESSKYLVFGGIDGEMTFPPGIKERAVVLIDQNSPEENRQLLGEHFLAEQWKDAFPYAVAETVQTGNPVAMKYVGACFLKWVEASVSQGAPSNQDKDFIAAAIKCLSLAIEHGERDWDVYQYRGAARLIAAQLKRDRQALDQAEADFRKSMSIKASDMVQRSLARVADVRKKCSPVPLAQDHNYRSSKTL